MCGIESILCLQWYVVVKYTASEIYLGYISDLYFATTVDIDSQ